jgi:hypothetical protein
MKKAPSIRSDGSPIMTQPLLTHLRDALSAEEERDMLRLEVSFLRADRDAERAHRMALAKELEQTADRLSDCWLLMDSVVRDHGTLSDFEFLSFAKGACASMLRRQQAPGWKDAENGKAANNG